MTNKIEQFLSEKFGKVGAIKVGNVIWFVASDIAKVLNFSSTQKVTDKIDDDDKDYRTWVTLGGEQKLTTINEGALYQVIFSITKKDKERYELAREFKRWITNEVIPTLRETGAYFEDNREEEVIDKYFSEFSDEVKLMMHKELKKKNAELKVKADSWDQFLDTDGTYTFTNVAKMISTKASEDSNKEIKISSQALTKYLREQGILSKAKCGKSYENTPNNEYEKYFNVTPISVGNGIDRTQTKVKSVGVEFIYGKLIEDEFGSKVLN